MSLFIQQPSLHRDTHLVAVPASRDVSSDTMDAEAVVALLQPLLADLLDLASQTMQAHWTVRGPHFVAHHLLFDELADRLREWGEALAERCVTLAGRVRGTARAVAQTSRLPEYPDDLRDGTAHIAALVERFALVCAQARAALDGAAAADHATRDALSTILRGLELDLWKLDSHRE